MTQFNERQIEQLKAPLNRAFVKEREQSGRKLSYIEGWRAIEEANRIFGFDAWNRETLDLRLVSERERKIGKQLKDGWGVTYTAKVRITIGTIVRDGVGSGHGIDVDLGLAHESAIKEAETDAMKRALMTFGYPFGLALYDKEQANVIGAPSELISVVHARCRGAKLTPDGIKQFCLKVSEGKFLDLALLPVETLEKIKKAGISAETAAECNRLAVSTSEGEDLPMLWSTNETLAATAV